MKATITGRKLNGNHINAPHRSCKQVDYPTRERVTVEVNGIEYERTIHERAIWKNGASNKHVALFVIVNGEFFEVEKSN